MSGNARVTQWF